MEALEEYIQRLLRLINEPTVDRGVVKRAAATLVSTITGGASEEIIERVLNRRLEVAETVVLSRISGFLEKGECKGLGLDAEICEFITRLVRAYSYLLAGLVMLDDAGRVYVKLLEELSVSGRRLPKGTILVVDPARALLLHALGAAKIATIKPIS